MKWVFECASALPQKRHKTFALNALLPFATSTDLHFAPCPLHHTDQMHFDLALQRSQLHFAFLPIFSTHFKLCMQEIASEQLMKMHSCGKVVKPDASEATALWLSSGKNHFVLKQTKHILKKLENAEHYSKNQWTCAPNQKSSKKKKKSKLAPHLTPSERQEHSSFSK